MTLEPEDKAPAFDLPCDGVIRRVWRKVKIKGHAEEVLAAVKEL